MSYEVLAIPRFIKDAKKLAKKYPSLKKDLGELIISLEKAPTIGISLGNNCYKVRLKISSKGKGKSGGGRVITYVQIIHEKVYLLSIYDKSEKDTLSDKDLSDLLNEIE